MTVRIFAFLIVFAMIAILVVNRSGFSGTRARPTPNRGEILTSPTLSLRSQYTPVPGEPNVKLVCPDCDAENIPIRIWDFPENGKVACELGERRFRNATLLGQVITSEGVVMLHVRNPYCTGWIAASLVDTSP